MLSGVTLPLLCMAELLLLALLQHMFWRVGTSACLQKCCTRVQSCFRSCLRSKVIHPVDTGCYLRTTLVNPNATH
jgi:hypothetical protein